MKDMISQILEIDKKAREADNQVQRDKLNLEQEIVLLKQKIREKYIARARKRISRNKVIEQEQANKKLSKILEHQEKISQDLDKSYLENSELWTQKIFNRIIGEW
jgi:hypothetical protein